MLNGDGCFFPAGLIFLKKRWLSPFLLCTVFLSGCVPVMIGAAATAAGGYVWTRGNLESTVEYSVVDLYAATRQALEECDVMVERDRHDRFEANLSGRSSDGRKVLIWIDGQTEYISQIRVRVGVMGDKHESQMLLNRILGNV